MEKKIYRQPQIDVYSVMSTDIIATSPGDLQVFDTNTETQETKFTITPTFDMEPEDIMKQFEQQILQ